MRWAGEPERVPVGGVRGGVVARGRVADAAQPGRLGGAEDLRGDRHGVQHGQRPGRLAGRDRQADVAQVVQVVGADAVAAAGQPLHRVGLGLLTERRPPGQRVAVRGPAARTHLVGADRHISAQLGVDVAQHPQAAVGVALVVEGDRVAQPDAGRREDLRGQPDRGADLPGLLDGGQRMPVKAQIGVRHGEVVPAPGGLLVVLPHRGQRPGRLDEMGDAAIQVALQM